VTRHLSSRSCVTAEEAFDELGIDRNTGYRAIKEGTFPVPVIRVGRLIRVPTAALLRVLAADVMRVGDGYVDPTVADGPPQRGVPVVARPESAHERNTVATRPARKGGHS